MAAEYTYTMAISGGRQSLRLISSGDSPGEVYCYKGVISVSNEKKTGLKRLEFLLGRWSGDGEGFGHKSKVENSYEYVLQGKFIQSRSHSVARDDDGNLIEVHEDIGMFSYDPDRDAIILREFYTEGYVNIYVAEEVGDSGGSLTFTSEKTEGAGGLGARLRLNLISEDEYVMFLDLARPGEEFRECQVIRMRRDAGVEIP